MSIFRSRKFLGILSLVWVAVFAVSMIVPSLVHPPAAHAADDWGVLNNIGGSDSNGSAGNAAMKKLADATTITFNNAGSIHVVLNFNEPLFDLGISNKTWGEVYSADYKWGQDADENWGYVMSPTDLGFKLSNDDPVSAIGFIKPHGNVPKPDASPADVAAWAKKLEIFYGLVRYTGHGVLEEYEYFVNIKDNGDMNGNWWKYFNSFGDNFATSDGDNGVQLADTFNAGRSNADNVLVRYVYNDGVIQAVKSDNQDAADYTYQSASTLPNYFKSSKDKKILYNNDWSSLDETKVKTLFAEASGNVQVTLHDGDKTSQVLVAGGKSTAAAQTAASDSGFGLGTSGGDENVTCENSGGGLSWAICPVINGALDGAQAVFTSFVEPYLHETPVSTDTSAENPVMVIWKAFRTIGNIVLIFALLLVVFGQSIGGGVVDAYTAKKTIPRILVAAILINLSIYICAIAVDIFNILGAGLVRIIVSPLQNADLFKVKPGNTGSAFLGISAILALVTGGLLFHFVKKGQTTNGAGGLGSILGWVLLFIVVPILLAMLGVFLTLLIRRALILALIIVSPIALALFAVPNAEKYTKKWFDAFIKTLMVYPIITGIFGISQVLAVVTYSAGGGTPGGSLVALLATLIIAFAPLFMIPFAFKLAGGVMGGVANTIKSGRDTLKKSWGDDKNNPYSGRNRAKDSIRKGAQHRAIYGVAGSSNRYLEMMNNRSSTLSAAKGGAAGSSAVKAAESRIKERKAMGVAITDEDAVKAASARAATAATTAGKSNKVAAWAGRAAGDASTDTKNEVSAPGYTGPKLTDEQIASTAAAAGRGTIDAAGAGYDQEQSLMAGEQARRAHMSGKYSNEEVKAIGLASAELHRSTQGKATQAQYDAAAEGAQRAHSQSKAAGGSDLRNGTVGRFAGAAAGRAANSVNPAVQAQAVLAGDTVAKTVGDAHDVGMSNGPGGIPAKQESRQNAEAAAYMATFNAFAGSPDPTNTAAHVAEGRQAIANEYRKPV